MKLKLAAAAVTAACALLLVEASAQGQTTPLAQTVPVGAGEER